MTEFFDIAYERKGHLGICKGCGAVYEGTAAFAAKHAGSGCIVPGAHCICLEARNAPGVVAAMGDILDQISAARSREERLRSELKRLSEMNLDLYDKLQEARRSAPEWWGTEAENKSLRRVYVRIGNTVMSSHDQVRWARNVMSAMVFGLSYGKTGNAIECERCGFVSCACMTRLR